MKKQKITLDELIKLLNEDEYNEDNESFANDENCFQNENTTECD